MRDIRLVSRMLGSFWRLVAEPWRMLNRRNLSRSNCAKRSTPLEKLLVSWIPKICWERSSANSASENEGSTPDRREPRTSHKGHEGRKGKENINWDLPSIPLCEVLRPAW